MEEYDPKFFELYDATRINLISILNEIVDSYTYKKPTLVDRAELDDVIEKLNKENIFLKETVSYLKADNKSSVEQIKKLRAELDTTSKKLKTEIDSKATRRVSLTKIEEERTSPKASRKRDTGKELSDFKHAMDVQHDESDKKIAPRDIPDRPAIHSKLLPNLTYKDLQQPVTSVNSKTLSLKQLKDLIEEVYDGKVVYDGMCKKENKTKETLEQYLFTHLRNKYGLNNIVAEWMNALIDALKTFMGKENDVTLFALVN